MGIMECIIMIFALAIDIMVVWLFQDCYRMSNRATTTTNAILCNSDFAWMGFYGVYHYIVDGRVYEYTHNVRCVSTDMLDKVVTVYYNPDNPKECLWVNWKLFCVVFIIVAIVLSAIVVSVVF